MQGTLINMPLWKQGKQNLISAKVCLCGFPYNEKKINPRKGTPSGIRYTEIHQDAIGYAEPLLAPRVLNRWWYANNGYQGLLDRSRWRNIFATPWPVTVLKRMIHAMAICTPLEEATWAMTKNNKLSLNIGKQHLTVGNHPTHLDAGLHSIPTLVVPNPDHSKQVQAAPSGR